MYSNSLASKRVVIGRALAIVLIATSVVAEEGESDSSRVVELNPYSVVVSTRTPLPLAEVSPSVSYISSGDLQRNQDRRVVDALQRETGVVLNTSGAPGSNVSLFIRGTDSDQTGFFLDGRRLNPGFGNQYNLEFLSLENLSSVQLQKGASSVNYGSSGIGGVLDLQTRSALDSGDATVSFEGEVGANDYHRGAASAVFSEKNWGLSLGVSELSTENERPNDYFDQSSLNARVDYRITKHLTGELIGFFTDSEKGNPNTEANQNLTDFGETESWLVSPGLRYENDDWSGQLFYSYSELTLDTTAFAFGSSAPFPSGLVEARSLTESNEVYLQLNYAGLESALLSFGTVYRHDEAFNSNLDSFDFTATPRPFRQRLEQFGLWAQAQVALTELLEVRVGGRYDDFSEFDSSANGNLEIIQTVGETGLSFFAKIASSYAPPNASVIAFDFDPVGSPLNPEESLSYEIGLRQLALEGTFSASLVAFRNEIDDLVTFVGLDAFNLNEATTEGVEFSVDYTGIDKLDLALGYTYLEAIDEENRTRLIRRPRHMLQVSAFYALQESLQVGLTGTGYFGREDSVFGPPPTFTQVRVEQEDFMVFELHVDWAVNEHFSLFARAENLLDESYESVLGFPALGRAGYIGARYTF